MKNKITYFIGITLLTLSGYFVGCSGNEETGLVVETCNTKTIENFDQFLGVQYGDEEQVLASKLGKFTSGIYTEDSAAFIYHFNRVDRVPVSVWVSTSTGKVITIFMEVVSLNENFNADLEKAITEFNIDFCESSWFGLTAGGIKNRLGTPSEEAYSDNGVLLLSYDSNDFFYTVAFKIYPQQNKKCSSVSVNWFYQE